jgi:D-apionolactonase
MTDLLTIYGTEEPPVPRQSLAAGPLTADLEAGQLRDIRWHGVLVLRGIAYLLRNADWGTLTVDLADLVVDEGPDAFAVTYTAAAPGLSYRAEIKGQASGHLHFAVTARANADFVTNRTGFVVLHPDTAAGGALTVTHTNGQIEATEFPARILPDQPAFDIAALLHHPVPGISATTSFDGGVFEMEDQRNWADASFKTYVRPVAWPRPYVIPAGKRDRLCRHCATPLAAPRSR